MLNFPELLDLFPMLCETFWNINSDARMTCQGCCFQSRKCWTFASDCGGGEGLSCVGQISLTGLWGTLEELPDDPRER